MDVGIYFTPFRLMNDRTPTGVGQHILHMVRGLVQDEGVHPTVLANRDEYRLVERDNPDALAGMTARFLPFSESVANKLLLAFGALHVERWAGPLDWVYCPKEQPVPTGKARLAVTVHDVLAFESSVREDCGKTDPIYRARWRWILSQILRRAHLIPTVSEFTKERLMALFDIKDEQKIAVVGNGIAPVFFRSRERDDYKVLERFEVTPEAYAVLIGGLTLRKGGDEILKLAKMLRSARPDLTILITGRRHDAPLVEALKAKEADDGPLPIRLTGYVSDADLAVLLSHAFALVFPSRYEGFGIPVVEAMAAGAPVISSRAAALPEIVGDAGLYAPRGRAEELLDALKELDGSADLRTRMVAAGRERARQYTWAKASERLIAAMAARN